VKAFVKKAIWFGYHNKREYTKHPSNYQLLMKGLNSFMAVMVGWSK